MDIKQIIVIFDIYSDTILLTKKLKAFLKLENLLEEQKNECQISFFSFNEEINQKIEMFVLEIKNKSHKCSPLLTNVKASRKASSNSNSNKQSKDFTVATSNKVSKEYTPISLNMMVNPNEKQQPGDNSDFSFTNTGKNSKSSLTFEERSKATNGYFQAFADKKNISKNPMGFIKYDNFFNNNKNCEETPKNHFFLLDSKKQESGSDIILPRKPFEDG